MDDTAPLSSSEGAEGGPTTATDEKPQEEVVETAVAEEATEQKEPQAPQSGEPQQQTHPPSLSYAAAATTTAHKFAAVEAHPLVVFSILDHFIRRQEGQERVIGTLLGTRRKKSATSNEIIVEVTNAFAVPHTEKEGEVAVGQSTNKTMYGLLSRVNPREKIVGWYSTTLADGRKFNESSTLIHDFYVHECDDPVHLVVDARATTERGVELSALAGSPAADGAAPKDAEAYFSSIPVQLAFSDAELLCVDRMMRGGRLDSCAEDDATLASLEPQSSEHASNEDAAPPSAESLVELPTEAEALDESMDDVVDLIETALDYVKAVKAGTRKADPEAIRHIHDALSALPKLDAADLEQTFQSNMQDIVMCSYLAAITKTQLAVAAKIHETF